MSGAIARVCMVVAAAILNHPLLFPQEKSTLPEQDDELVTRMRLHEEQMRAHEERLLREQSKLEDEERESRLESQRQQSEGSPDEAYVWYFWSAVSLVVFLAVEVSRVDLVSVETWTTEDEDMCPGDGLTGARTMVLDKDLLSQFCDRCLYTLSHENCRVKEFVDGLADDLLESMGNICNTGAHMRLGDFLGVGSTFESWKVGKPLTCDLIVPFTPPAPYSFRYHPWCGPDSRMPPDLQGFAAIEVTRENQGAGCGCDSLAVTEDVLCLLHSKTAGLDGADRSHEDLLCSRDTSSLSKDQVMRWFQISVSKAWGRIAHKYDFELAFHQLDTAGALKVRFRSGKVIVMNLIPSVQLDDTDAYFVSHFPSDTSSPPDTYWPLSLAVYERKLLKHFARTLPETPCHLHCLQVLTFLHKKQTGLTGECALTNYHLKTVVLHLLLLSRRPSRWAGRFLEERLRDALAFLQRCLSEKMLRHALVGNRELPGDLGLPQVFRTAEPVNLFRVLVLQRAMYADTVRHLQEMLRNAPALLQEYTPRLLSGDSVR